MTLEGLKKMVASGKAKRELFDVFAKSEPIANIAVRHTPDLRPLRRETIKKGNQE